MAEPHRDEIAKLEALFAENPEGRVFTHLADAYRKAGELERAYQILEEGLKKHSSYASAHVVMGRVLTDQKKGDDAAASFRRVLELDPHNLIALRALGDLARAAGRNEEALGYYRQLLALDPSNEQIEELIVALGGAVEEASTARPDSFFGGGAVVVKATPAAAAPTAPAAAPAQPEGDGVALEGLGAAPVAEASLPFETGPAAGDVDLVGAPTDAGAVEDVPLAGVDFGLESTSLGADGPMDLGGPAIDLEPTSLALEPSDVAAPESMPETAEPLFGTESRAAEPAELVLGPEEAVSAPEEAAPAPEAAPLAFGGEEPWAAPPEPVLGGEMVTETMADLYAAQGQHARAAEFYRELLRTRPGDAALTAKLAQLETPAPFAAAPEMAAPEAAAPEQFESAWTGAGGAAADVASPYGWTEEPAPAAAPPADEPSIASYFESLLSWRPTAAQAAPPPPAAAAPTPPAMAEPTPAPAAAAAPPPAPSAQPVDDLDELFGMSPVSASPAPSPPASAAEPVGGGLPDFLAEPPASAEAAPPESDEDLESFKTWLQNLKQ